MFWNNRNKRKTNWNSSKFVKISTFFIPHTIRSVCFGCFDTGPKHQNKPQKNFWGFAKKQTEKQPKQIEFRFESRKKINGFEDPLIEKVFWRFFGLFRFVLRKFCLFRFVLTPVRNTATNQKKCFWFPKTNQKTTETDWVSVCFSSNRKKNLIVSRTPYFQLTMAAIPSLCSLGRI